jgi:hypothetical protein
MLKSKSRVGHIIQEFREVLLFSCPETLGRQGIGNIEFIQVKKKFKYYLIFYLDVVYYYGLLLFLKSLECIALNVQDEEILFQKVVTL